MRKLSVKYYQKKMVMKQQCIILRRVSNKAILVAFTTHDYPDTTNGDEHKQSKWNHYVTIGDKYKNDPWKVVPRQIFACILQSYIDVIYMVFPIALVVSG